MTSQGRGIGARAQGVPGSRRPPRMALRRRRARQHRKAAARSPRPAPSEASDALWARSRRGPRSEKVMAVAEAPARRATAPNGRTQRGHEPPAPPVAKSSARRTRGGSAGAAGGGSCELMPPTLGLRSGWVWAPLQPQLARHVRVDWKVCGDASGRSSPLSPGIAWAGANPEVRVSLSCPGCPVLRPPQTSPLVLSAAPPCP